MGMGIARRGQPPIGERAMTDAQRQRRRRWKLRASAPPVARTGQRQRPYDRILTLWEQLREAWKRIDALKAECDWLAWNRKGRVLPSRPRRRYTGTCAPRCIPIAREIKARFWIAVCFRCAFDSSFRSWAMRHGLIRFRQSFIICIKRVHLDTRGSGSLCSRFRRYRPFVSCRCRFPSFLYRVYRPGSAGIFALRRVDARRIRGITHRGLARRLVAVTPYPLSIFPGS
jgi:hypothetical protein